MVGAARFELATPWSQTRCATRLRQAPTELCLDQLARGFKAIVNHYENYRASSNLKTAALRNTRLSIGISRPSATQA